VLISLLAIAALVYYRGWLRLRRLLPHLTPASSLYAFVGGLSTLWAAVGSPLATLDEQLLSVHMVQHLLLSTVAAPLILLGAPALPLFHGVPRRFVLSGLAPLFRSGPVRALGRLLGQPAVCWCVAIAVFIGWHTPSLFQFGLRSYGWHAVEHASFFGSGLLFWWPVIQPWPSAGSWPRWSVPLYLFLATLPCDALSAFLVFSDRVVYPMYLSGPRHVALSVLQDQASAGALMWVGVTIAYVIPAAVTTITLLSPRDAEEFR
jgi:putative membrane protein